MSPLLLVVCLGLAVAAPPADTVSPKAEFKIWAVEVHSEGRDRAYFDKGLEDIQETVRDSAHDTYLNLKTASHGFKDANPVRTPLNEQYTLETSAPARAEDGRYRVSVRVTLKSKGSEKSSGSSSPLLSGESLVPKQKNPGRSKEIEAMASKLLLQPEQKVVMRGFKLEDGKEMVLVVSLSVPDGAVSKP